MTEYCEHCGQEIEPSLDEVYGGYWESVRVLMERGLLPKDFAERELKESVRQAQLILKILDSGGEGRTVKFAQYEPLRRVDDRA